MSSTRPGTVTRPRGGQKLPGGRIQRGFYSEVTNVAAGSHLQVIQTVKHHNPSISFQGLHHGPKPQLPNIVTVSQMDQHLPSGEQKDNIFI